MSFTTSFDDAGFRDSGGARVRPTSTRNSLMIVAAIVALSALGTAPGAEAQTAVAVPDNATARRYGGSWTCNHGYRRTGGASESCVAVVVPLNAYLSASGDDWECERLFRERDGACEALVVPANASPTTARTGAAGVANRVIENAANLRRVRSPTPSCRLTFGRMEMSAASGRAARR
jgi:hypothetical protein